MRRLESILVALLFFVCCPLTQVRAQPTPPAVQQFSVTLQGTVHAPDGKPVAGARVDVRAGEMTDGILSDTVTDLNGEFALLGLLLPPGKYVVHASARGFEADEKAVTVSSSSPVTLTLALTLKPQFGTRGLSSAFTVVRVFYATDRAVVAEGFSLRYLGTKTEKGGLAYGSCEVSIPETHTIAEIERPSIWRMEFHADPEKHMILQKVESEQKDRFFRDLSGSVSASPSKEAFVFVHGYNVSFEDAAIRTAQLAYDFGFKGAPILYSWPSEGRLLGYFADEKSVADTVGDLKQFLQDVATSSGATTVHLIAHSMGNRALLAAVSELAADARFTSFNRFSSLVLAAPDVDRGTFTNQVSQIRKFRSRITLYVSDRDQALVASHRLFHMAPRAGEGGSNALVMPGVDTVDVSKQSMDALGHSYYGDNRNVVLDLLAFLKGQIAPRPGLTRVPVGALAYWLMTPATPGK
jgi:esterase/lipase superfamily enzyme